MPSLFSLFVDLKANTADFVTGMSKASYEAKRAGRDIEDSFSKLGSIASAALAPFGELGAGIGETLSQIGEYASTASAALAKLGGGMSGFAVGGGLAAGAMAAVGAGAIGLAVHTAKTADEMFHLAESSGVSVEALSRLSFVAKQYDIDQESLTKGLQMMAVQMEKAATAGPGVVTVFDRLHLSIRNVDGSLKDSGEMFDEIVKKLDAMKDRTAAVGMAREIFGRNTGAAVLRIDPEGLEQWSEVAEKTHSIVTEQMGEASHQFETSLNVIGAAAEGAALGLTGQMLPALNAIAGAFATVASSSSSAAGPIGGVTAALKYFLQIADFVYTELDLVTMWLAKTAVAWEVFGEGAASAASRVAHLDFSGAAAAWKDTFAQLDAIQADYLARGKQNWENYQKFIGGVFAKPQTTSDKKPKGGKDDVDLTPRTQLGLAQKDTIADLVTQLAAQSSAELSLASSISSSVAAMTLEKAAGEADVKIASERTQLLERERMLRSELANAQAEQLPGEVNQYQQELAAVQGYLKELDSAAPQIRQRYLEIAAAKMASSTNEDLGKETLKFDVQISSLNEMVAAYKQGGAAIAGADIGKQLEADRQKVADLAEAYGYLAAEEPQNISALAQLGSALLAANAALEEHQKQLEAIRSLSISEEIGKDTRAFEDQQPALEKLADAYLHGADAVRAAQVGLKLADFESKNPGASAGQIAQITALYQQQSQAAYDGALAQEAAQYSLNQKYGDQIERLNQIREILQGYGIATLQVDAAIYDAQNEQIQEWDEAAIKVGTLQQRMQAFFNEIQQQGQKFGENVFASLSKTMDDISTQLARLVVTGKSSFLQMWQGLAEAAAKAQFQRIFGEIAGGFSGAQKQGATGPGGTAGIFRGPISSTLGNLFGVKSPGAAEMGGSLNDPLYVIPVDPQGNYADFSGEDTSGSVGPGNLWKGLIGSDNSSARSSGTPGSILPGHIWDSLIGSDTASGDVNSANTWSGLIGDDSGGSGQGTGIGSSIGGMLSQLGTSFSSIFKTIGSSAGSIFSGIGSFFGGFLAGGGDVSPGKAYVVGEKHPEFFLPRQPGHVAPALHMQKSHTVNNHIYIQGVKDFDSFRKSSGQVLAAFHRQTQTALERNG